MVCVPSSLDEVPSLLLEFRLQEHLCHAGIGIEKLLDGKDIEDCGTECITDSPVMGINRQREGRKEGFPC